MAYEDERYPASFTLADYLISESRERGELLTPLKLQKLMYYSDAWHLALYDTEITVERFQAWVHGPVALSQYHRFKNFKWRPIDAEIECPDLPIEMVKHLDEVVDVFGSETAVALEIMTHKEQPWLDARGDLAEDEPCNNYISKEITKYFYRSVGN
ncbi:Panacea domain-containing protein [Stappia sp. ES.058]|uniref:Panacea domain-containing protein n=1 Tax=Stappia sp. ES.058 TaxID=1881061 RepID=UPI00087AA439|nr:type II toxin-antitoxin system antitoxin SocA domain-containing protein [Stappia sp. ES.058]SDT91851.1 Uncharacterized phage-associated protein [Stappia sp. ES.058]